MAWIFILWAASVGMASTGSQCLQRDLERKDCLLRLKPYNVQVSRVKVTWSDGTWTSIADAPLPDEKFQWEKVRLDQVAHRWLVQFWIWDSGQGQANVQSLHWVVAELSGHSLTIRLNQIVRRRHLKQGTAKSYTYDPWIAHSLKAKANVIYWSFGRTNGLF